MSNQPLITLYDHPDWQLRSAELWDAEPICQYFCRNKAYLKPWEPEREAGFYQVNHWRQKLVKLAELHRLSLGFYFIIFHPVTRQGHRHLVVRSNHPISLSRRVTWLFS